eukprot:CAMPEP_0182904040 /NCGR_PEP_ID=MMETSP0034_2-20130328/31809_1 /TAXON_ID=156128 /ORGANISM="Nephroselmis pyriformis, Strain CCMP717" /LENGTH=67 /DNA_ID=CAMNT_0025039115 /DNA_START=329 /DNA_END=532 /DNA_ORIENTATION=+
MGGEGRITIISYSSRGAQPLRLPALGRHQVEPHSAADDLGRLWVLAAALVIAILTTALWLDQDPSMG